MEWNWRGMREKPEFVPLPLEADKTKKCELKKKHQKSNFQAVIDKIGTIFAKNLPHFAIPIFLRICDQLERTGTFKLKKAKLQQEGIGNVEDGGNIFFWDKHKKKYVENKKMPPEFSVKI